MRWPVSTSRIWDLFGKNSRIVPVSTLLGGAVGTLRIPAYVSGLPARNASGNAATSPLEWIGQGVQGHQVRRRHVRRRHRAPRWRRCARRWGRTSIIMVDLHWKFEASRGHPPHPPARRPITSISPRRRCQPEDIEGQVRVAQRHRRAAGARARNGAPVYEFRPRFESRAMSIVQPEIGHSGITEFMQIGRMAQTFHMNVIPHASISVGIFMAASLQAASALQNVPYHEYQHSVFDRNLGYTTGDMGCEAGFYTVPSGPGLGVEPSEAVFDFVVGQ
jgi:L-alanine-DL-glutamate epimerase-like enolase superfamily enzyme